MGDPAPSFLERHEFLIRRLHSLTGLIPVGAYMVVHLLTNASVLNGWQTFQNNVYTIHSLGNVLPLVEWAFIFLPILFHAVIGVWIVAGGLPNQQHYGYGANWRYFLQRVTGVIAFVFILFHVLHLHGILHAEWWLGVVKPLGGAAFRPYNATSTAGAALQGMIVAGAYAVGVLACVFHLANGIWTMGITWGAWTTPAAQRAALRVCALFGLGLAAVGLSALWGVRQAATPDKLPGLIAAERRVLEARVEGGMVQENEEKALSEADAERLTGDAADAP